MTGLAVASQPDVRVFASGRGPVTLRGTTAVGPWQGNLVGRSHGTGDPHHRRVLPRGRLPPRPVPRMSAAPARTGTGPRGQRGADGRDRRRVPRPRHRPGPARPLPPRLRPPVPRPPAGPPHHVPAPGGE